MTENPQPIDATARTELILPEKAESSLATAGLSSEGATSLRRAFSAHFAHFNDISKEATAVRPDEPAKARVSASTISTGQGGELIGRPQTQ